MSPSFDVPHQDQFATLTHPISKRTPRRLQQIQRRHILTSSSRIPRSRLKPGILNQLAELRQLLGVALVDDVELCHAYQRHPGCSRAIMAQLLLCRASSDICCGVSANGIQAGRRSPPAEPPASPTIRGTLLNCIVLPSTLRSLANMSFHSP
jgi:hypothetical protein